MGVQRPAKAQVIEIIKKSGQVRPQDLVRSLGITRAAVHRHLKALVSQGILEKYGSPPQVFYKLIPQKERGQAGPQLSQDLSNFLADRYLYVTPDGHLLKGEEGFREWALRTKQGGNRLPRLAEEFKKNRLEADHFFKDNSWIEATEKFRTTFGTCYLDKVFYEDFYSLPKFGKTEKGQLVLQGKQGQKLFIIRQLARSSKPVLEKIIKEFGIEAIGWVPHSIPREISFIKEYQKELGLPLPTVEIVKAYAGEVPVAQKTLAKLEERIANAENTFFLKNPHVPYKTVLLVDDAVGSGATLNELAKKLKIFSKVKKVYGFAIVGSLKGFEVLREI